MGKTGSYDALLSVCIQDLHGGETMLADTLPQVARHANDPALAGLLAEVSGAAEEAAETLAETGRHEGGTKNLWMEGICKDARRDTGSIAAGPLLDAAIVGAIRKAKAAQIVSYDTAIAVAGALDEVAIGAALTAIRERAVGADRRLATHLPQAKSGGEGRVKST